MRRYYSFTESELFLIGSKVTYFSPVFRESIVSISDLDPMNYLNFAKQDYDDGGNRGYINCLSNVKRSLHLQVDMLLRRFGLRSLSTNMNFPTKLELLKDLSLAPTRMVRGINQDRNLMEHQYIVPDATGLPSSLETCELFLMATERYFVSLQTIFRIGLERDNEDYCLVLNSTQSRIELVQPLGEKDTHTQDDITLHLSQLEKPELDRCEPIEVIEIRDNNISEWFTILDFIGSTARVLDSSRYASINIGTI